MTALSKATIVNGVSIEVQWWIRQRLSKLKTINLETMTINPLMAPLIVALHSHSDFEELAEFLLAGHFMVGHATGFGKLVDEKILPNVFGTKKLDKRFRDSEPYGLSVFSEIDHLIADGTSHALLSLKASRWTIQLTMAVQINHSFYELIKLRSSRSDVNFSKIVVGVIYGTVETLTDKFAIIRGICAGASHDVFDIAEDVEIVVGSKMWSRLNADEENTQTWVLDGIIDALIKSSDELREAKKLLSEYKSRFSKKFEKHINSSGEVDWHSILREISG